MADAAWALGAMLEGKWVTCPPIAPVRLRLVEGRIYTHRRRQRPELFVRHLLRDDWTEWADTALTARQARQALRSGLTVRHPGMPAGTGLRALSDGAVIIAVDGDAQTRPYQMDLDELERDDWTTVELAPPPPEES